MTWTLSELASLAEIIGLLAIIPSLLFVGVQLARGRREIRAATLQATLTSERELNAKFADYAGTWDKVVKGEPLSEGEETRRAIVLFNMLMMDTENRFQQFKSGYLDPESWEARHSTLHENVSFPIFKVWRNSPGGRNRSAEFLRILDKMAGETRD